MNNEKAYERIEKKVEERLGFYSHLAAYIVINLFLIILNLTMTPEYYWFIWPLMGWGAGLILHGMMVFGFGGGSVFRERMIDAELEKAGMEKEGLML